MKNFSLKKDKNKKINKEIFVKNFPLKKYRKQTKQTSDKTKIFVQDT